MFGSKNRTLGETFEKLVEDGVDCSTEKMVRRRVGYGLFIILELLL